MLELKKIKFKISIRKGRIICNCKYLKKINLDLCCPLNKDNCKDCFCG